MCISSSRHSIRLRPKIQTSFGNRRVKALVFVFVVGRILLRNSIEIFMQHDVKGHKIAQEFQPPLQFEGGRKTPHIPLEARFFWLSYQTVKVLP